MCARGHCKYASSLSLSPVPSLSLFLPFLPPSLSLSLFSLPPSLPLGASWFDAQLRSTQWTDFSHLNCHYADALATDFGDLSLQQQVQAYVRMLYKVQCTYQNFICLAHKTLIAVYNITIGRLLVRF